MENLSQIAPPTSKLNFDEETFIENLFKVSQMFELDIEAVKEFFKYIFKELDYGSEHVKNNTPLNKILKLNITINKLGDLIEELVRIKKHKFIEINNAFYLKYLNNTIWDQEPKCSIPGVFCNGTENNSSYKFGWFTGLGRHHCRGCGKAMCERCSVNIADNIENPIWLCITCNEQVSSFNITKFYYDVPGNSAISEHNFFEIKSNTNDIISEFMLVDK